MKPADKRRILAARKHRQERMDRERKEFEAELDGFQQRIKEQLSLTVGVEEKKPVRLS